MSDPRKGKKVSFYPETKTGRLIEADSPPPRDPSVGSKQIQNLMDWNPPIDGHFLQFMKTDSSVSRPGFNTTGREVNLQLNAYPIDQFPTRTVFQYDVSGIHPDACIYTCIWHMLS
jgi:hypothetical protein